jgi:IclR family mhp operon transcriptional activator
MAGLSDLVLQTDRVDERSHSVTCRAAAIFVLFAVRTKGSYSPNSTCSLARIGDCDRTQCRRAPQLHNKLLGRTGLNRTTCYRLLDTLQDDGYISFDENVALFSLTHRVRSLSECVTTRDLSSQAALPPMFDLLKMVSWPSDYAVFDLGSVLVRESTHPFSPIHRSMIGRRRSLLRSALGRAILAAARPALRREMLEITGSMVEEGSEIAKDCSFVNRIVAQTAKFGYASSVGETQQGISAIALAIHGEGAVLDALNLIFFSSSMTPEVAAERYLGNLKEAVTSIERRLATAVGSAAPSV